MPLQPPLLYDPSNPAFPAHAHEVYDRLREEEPFHWASRTQEWVVTKHADVKAVIKHPSLKPPNVMAYLEGVARHAAVEIPAMRLLCQEALIFQSGPGHAQARRFMARILNYRPLSECAPIMEEIIGRQIKALLDAGGGDLIVDFGRAIGWQFMGRLLGVPAEEMEFLADCAEGILLILERQIEPDLLIELNSAVAQAIDCLTALCAERRKDPRNDGLSRMLELAPEEPDRVLAMRTFFLFVAGLDTMATFLGRSMHALLENPGARERLSGGEVAVAGAIEELLRYTSPVRMVICEAAHDCDVSGHFVARGQKVTALIEAANRDPVVFDAPHELRLDRDPCPHLVFSEGVHACLGAGLARLQGTIALREFARLPRMRLVEKPRLAHSDIMKFLKTLYVSFE
ncbi:MAG: hypothetical protein JWL59_2852 [Chthoniobacteraceae bacterium]|nr:hypothetical protein [Chthoniobacteraceae bacterium]